METTFDRISRKTGRKPMSCKCKDCKNQCTIAPCLGTPEDIEKIIDAGYKDMIKETVWASGIIMGVTTDTIRMYQAEMTHTGCAFFKNGLCELHDKGLKPTEGKLSHHTIKEDNYNPRKGLSWNVAKEWISPDNEEAIQRISEKIK